MGTTGYVGKEYKDFLCKHEWQILGIKAAINDKRDDVKLEALDILSSGKCLNNIENGKVNDLAISMLNLGDDKQTQLIIKLIGNLGSNGSRYKEKLIPFLHDDNESIRKDACEALGKIGNLSKSEYDEIVNLLKDKEVIVRKSVIKALKQNPELSNENILKIVENLDDENYRIIISSLECLSIFKDKAKVVLPKLFLLMNHQKHQVRKSSIGLIGDIGISSPEILNLLKEKARIEKSAVRGEAIRSIFKLSDDSNETIYYLLNSLKKCDKNTCLAIYESLSESKNLKKEHYDLILKIYNNQCCMGKIAASFLLLEQGELPEKIVFDIIKSYEKVFLKTPRYTMESQGSITLFSKIPENLANYIDNTANSEVYLSYFFDMLPPKDNLETLFLKAIFREIKYIPKDYIKKIISYYEAEIIKPSTFYDIIDNKDIKYDEILEKFGEILTNNNENLEKSYLIKLLCRQGASAKKYLPSMLDYIKKNKYDKNLLLSISMVDNIDFSSILYIINLIYEHPSDSGFLRFVSHLFGSARKDIETLLIWTGDPKLNKPDDINGFDPIVTLEILSNFLMVLNNSDELYSDLCLSITNIIIMNKKNWKSNDVKFLDQIRGNIKNPNLNQNIKNIIDEIKPTPLSKFLYYCCSIIICHFIFWMSLILIYPKSYRIQAFFFWNTKVRKYFGLVYVELLILYIPFLRKRIFKPFTRSLISDARQYDFDEKNYFKDSTIIDKNSNVKGAITKIIQDIKGHVILIGDSGTGKTTFLRYQINNNSNLRAFLLAIDCKEGIVEGICNKLQGFLSDKKFIKSLIYSGFITIYIDGLNDVDKSTRKLITRFLNTYTKCNVIITMQKIDWEPTCDSKVYEFERITFDQTKNFIYSRYDLFIDDVISREEYIENATKFITSLEALYKNSDSFEQVECSILNLMDLSTACMLLRQGIQPNLLNLQDQQFKIIQKEYRKRHANTPFPIKTISNFLYGLKKNGMNYFETNEFTEEFSFLNKYKMVLKRYREMGDDKSKIVWYFRHEKISDYLISYSFITDRERQIENLNSPIFYGVFNMLSMILPIKDAEWLREQIIRNSVVNKNFELFYSFENSFVHRKNLKININNL
ncbi:HEAT repeat domain-containing protein [uncultured Desulfosarcina sp.]|uniref:HEAT repeat domain-containing protein n=1 Tax=uncultured Desulfosarcina sp. TaxID=218289 RepID=UPI0029C8FDCC|nr:HEAT repeat domain-containing protein [uncultured Desulfosarcina sp.]